MQNSNGLFSIGSTNIQICDCNQKDSASQCQFDTTQVAINPYVTMVKCKCTQFYTGNKINITKIIIFNIFKFKGSYCNETIDYCGTSKPCDAITKGYNINYTCINLPVDEQKSKNLTYYCNGTCPVVGYTKTTNGFCEGKRLAIIYRLKYNSFDHF